MSGLVQKISEPTFATTHNNSTLERSTFTRVGKTGNERRNFVAVDHNPG